MPTIQQHKVSLSKHEVKCLVCKHLQRQEIEEDYANFVDEAEICKKYNLDKYTLRQHCTALRLWIRQAHNIPAVMIQELQRGLKIKPKPRYADLINIASEIRKDLGLYQHRDTSLQLYSMTAEAIKELAKQALERLVKTKQGVATIETQGDGNTIVPSSEQSKTIAFDDKSNGDKEIDETSTESAE